MLIMKTKVDPSQRKCTITFKIHVSNTLELHYQILSQEIQGPITKKIYSDYKNMSKTPNFWKKIHNDKVTLQVFQ